MNKIKKYQFKKIGFIIKRMIQTFFKYLKILLQLHLKLKILKLKMLKNPQFNHKKIKEKLLFKDKKFLMIFLKLNNR